MTNQGARNLSPPSQRYPLKASCWPLDMGSKLGARISSNSQVARLSLSHSWFSRYLAGLSHTSGDTMWLNLPADKRDLHPAVQETCPVSEKNFVAHSATKFFSETRSCAAHSPGLMATCSSNVRAKNGIAINSVDDILHLGHATYEHQWISLIGLIQRMKCICIVAVFCVYYTYYICICHWCPCVYSKINMYTVCIYIYTYLYRWFLHAYVYTEKSNFDMLTHEIPGKFHQSSCM